MRRLARFTSRCSLVLAFLTIALWTRSHLTDDLVYFSRGNGNYYEFVTIPGQFRVTRVTGWVGTEPPRWIHGGMPAMWPVFGQQAVYRSWTVLGIGFDGGSRLIPGPAGRVTVSYQIMAVPFALPALVFGAIGLLPWLRLRRQKQIAEDRLKHGLCPACGYDLRATTARCPECGADVAQLQRRSDPLAKLSD
jgi:hypothetical protein